MGFESRHSLLCTVAVKIMKKEKKNEFRHSDSGSQALSNCTASQQKYSRNHIVLSYQVFTGAQVKKTPEKIMYQPNLISTSGLSSELWLHFR